MARTVSRRATGTTLVWGRMPPVPVDLFKTTKAQPEADFETRWVGEVEAGPVELDTRPEPVVPEPSAPPTDPLAEELPRPGEMTPEALAEAFDIPPAEVEAPRLEKRKGLTIDGRWLDLTENLDAITDATRLEEMRVIGFVPSPSVPRVLVTGSYYIGSGGPGAPKVLRALEEGMRAHHAVAVVKWTKTSRQALGVIVASKKAMYVLELAWAGDLLEPSPRVLGHRGAELTDGERRLAADLVRAMMGGPGVIEEQEDDAVVMRKQLRAAAEAGLVDAWEAPSAERTAEEIESLEEALEASLEGAEDDALGDAAAEA